MAARRKAACLIGRCIQAAGRPTACDRRGDEIRAAKPAPLSSARSRSRRATLIRADFEQSGNIQ